MGPCTVAALTSLADIDRLVGWETLTAPAPATITASRNWVRAAFDELHLRAHPLVLAAKRNGRLVGILSLVVEPSPSGSLARIAGDPLNDVADALVDPRDPDAAPALARAVQNLPRGDVAVRLNELDPAGNLLSAIDALGTFVRTESDAPTIALGSGRGPSRARRKELDRSLRRLRERHTVRFGWEPSHTVPEALVDLLRLRRERLSVTGRTSLLPSIEHEPGFERFLRRIAHALSATSRCAIATLSIDGTAAARDLYLVDGKVAMLFLRGLASEWRTRSCGHLLLCWAIEDLTRTGFATLDLGRGDEDYKYAFGAVPRCLATVTAGCHTTRR